MSIDGQLDDEARSLVFIDGFAILDLLVNPLTRGAEPLAAPGLAAATHGLPPLIADTSPAAPDPGSVAEQERVLRFLADALATLLAAIVGAWHEQETGNGAEAVVFTVTLLAAYLSVVRAPGGDRQP